MSSDCHVSPRREGSTHVLDKGAEPLVALLPRRRIREQGGSPSWLARAPVRGSRTVRRVAGGKVVERDLALGGRGRRGGLEVESEGGLRARMAFACEVAQDHLVLVRRGRHLDGANKDESVRVLSRFLAQTMAPPTTVSFWSSLYASEFGTPEARAANTMVFTAVSVFGIAIGAPISAPCSS